MESWHLFEDDEIVLHTDTQRHIPYKPTRIHIFCDRIAFNVKMKATINDNDNPKVNLNPLHHGYVNKKLLSCCSWPKDQRGANNVSIISSHPEQKARAGTTTSPRRLHIGSAVDLAGHHAT